MEPFIAMIVGFGGNFAPRGWALCEGQLLPISQNTALFSLLGTTYGGDGRTTFALPDLRGRFPIHPGNGPGLTPIRLGEKGGRETVTLTAAMMPAHNHAASFNLGQGIGTSAAGDGEYLAFNAAGETIFTSTVPNNNSKLGSDSVSVEDTGSGQDFAIRNPYLAINMIIALQGVFPSRS
ncbi:microcystin-dependent protein [Lewinella aquimaris]|uniref:Microcystin-dependent protein n=1 Tax=Neolewinella aquimaris TaxID=1835722 RepID=A0A840E7E5_9BACT|nr:tail fiber protein [Neolewinella aquimaris]MBB4080960.1 microcystin-dependent protein [Neolewinella aquimaris]